MIRPFDREELLKIFKISLNNPSRLIARENSILEFKESYNHSGMAQYFKTIAAFANANGGYIVFGVTDNPRTLKGLDENSYEQFSNIKVEVFTNHLNDYFSPEIKWEMRTYEDRGKRFGLIYVYELENKPAICKKENIDKNNTKYTLKESDIYYRYRGRSERIKFPELRMIIESRRDAEQKQWMNLFSTISRIGVENASVLDLTSGKVEGKSGVFLVDETLLSQITFIKEGQFVESKGEPTLKLIGDVQPINKGFVVKETVKEIGIHDSDIINVMLKSQTVDKPVDYIKQICYESSAFLPVYYYIGLTGISIEEIIEIIKSVAIHSIQKRTLLNRLIEERTEHIQKTNSFALSVKKKTEFANLIVNNAVPTTIDKTELDYWLQGVNYISKNEVKENKNYICNMMLKWFEEYYPTSLTQTTGLFRKAVCWVDEALYKT